MKHTIGRGLLVGAAIALSSTVALAQSTTTSTTATGTNTATGAGNSAVDTKNTADKSNMVEPSALEQGANSFTEGEARSRLESAGMADVNGLKKDDKGIWRGSAKHEGKSVSVGLDYKGHISAQ